jgi:hypothetical protein
VILSFLSTFPPSHFSSLSLFKISLIDRSGYFFDFILLLQILLIQSFVSKLIFLSSCLSSAIPLPNPWPFFAFLQLYEYYSPEKNIYCPSKREGFSCIHGISLGLGSRWHSFCLFSYLYTFIRTTIQSFNTIVHPLGYFFIAFRSVEGLH